MFNMCKTIICPIEASDEGKMVLGKAQAIAEQFGARLIVINVLPYQFLPKDYQKELKEKLTPKMEEIFDSLKIAKKNRMVKVGKPADVICKEAEKREADLIIIGTHSKTGLNALLGSTANGVVNKANCDVMLIKI